MRLAATGSGDSSSGHSSALESQQVAQLEAENRELRRRLKAVADWASHEDGEAGMVQAAAIASQAAYRVDVLSEGFWDGKYRARCGFRVIGIYDSLEAAWDHACMDFAMSSARIRPTRASSSGASPAAAVAATSCADERTGSAGSPMPAS